MPSKKIDLQIVQAARHVVKATKSKTDIFKKEIIQYLDVNGYLSWSSKERKYMILGTNSPKNGLVECPECRLGQLMVSDLELLERDSWVVQIFMEDVRHHRHFYKKQNSEQ